MKSLCTVLLTLAGLSSAQAFTCDDVRALSPEQRAYYIKVFNITPALQDRIRQVCSGSRVHRTIDVAEGRLTVSPRHPEQDARSGQ